VPATVFAMLVVSSNDLDIPKSPSFNWPLSFRNIFLKKINKNKLEEDENANKIKETSV